MNVAAGNTSDMHKSANGKDMTLSLFTAEGT